MADPGEVGGFRFTAQAAAFLSVIAILAAALALSWPLAAVVLGAAGVLGLSVIAIRAALRSRSGGSWRLTATEGAVGMSGFVVGVAGAAVTLYIAAGIGLRGEVLFPSLYWPSREAGQPVGTRSVSYPDADKQKRLREELAKAGIPFTLETHDGKEWITWKREHDDAAEAIQKRVREGPLPYGRSVHFPDPAHRQDFIDWLSKKGVKPDIVRIGSDEYVVWPEGVGETQSVMNEYMAQRSSDCARKKPRC